jgi:putative membrane-bound dehydrogenase-like protein
MFRPLGCLLLLTLCSPTLAQDNSAPPNTQAETEKFLTPAEALAAVRAPTGYEVTLFAHEPMVRQPIAMAWDPKGRLWIAENDTYAEASVNYDLKQSDRIIILTDEDQNGKADKRKVFLDGLKRLTSVELGYGGVYAMAPPYLYFIPDANGDDKPDGEPQILLDGWDIETARHNFANGLKWGPDGWLYGRNGIQAPSRPGTPATPADKRPLVTGAIWRFHPKDHRFEVVAEGTTNPWGHDWDEHGQLFFINTVIGHLWHAPHGAHFRRMYGEDSNPYTYELIEQTADHVHWDAGKEDWTAQRKGVTEGTDKAGGGHAHSGMLIYQGSMMPDLRGKMLTVNLHGHRLNVDKLVREGATYVGKHDNDFVKFGDPYFRGVDLSTGPDGAIYVIDWSDIGECHENDGIHRTSGRIFRISNDTVAPPPSKFVPFSSRSAIEIVQSISRDPNAIPGLQRLRQGTSKEEQKQLRDYANSVSSLHKVRPVDDLERLRAKWVLAAAGILSRADIVEMGEDSSEHVRVWAIRFAFESGMSPAQLEGWLSQIAKPEKSGLVLVELASALQRLPVENRWGITSHLVRHGELANDRAFPLMVWYGLEAAVQKSPDNAAGLIPHCKLPKLTELIARRIGDALIERPDVAVPLMRLGASEAISREDRGVILRGLRKGLEGVQRAPQVAYWTAFIEKAKSEDANRELANEIATIFGEGRAIDSLRDVVKNGKLAPEVRRRAIRTIASAKVDGLQGLLLPMIGDRDVGATAIRGLGIVLDLDLGKKLAPLANSGFAANRLAIVETLVTRPDTAKHLLSLVAEGKVAQAQIPAHVIRQFYFLGDKEIADKARQIWPDSGQVKEERLAKIRDFQAKFTADSLPSANAAIGRATFEKLCGRCHKLFGEGGEIAPDLTGAQRTNLNYWIDNILDPSAMVAANYRMSVINLRDGRVLSGVIAKQTDRAITLHMASETITIEHAQVEEIGRTDLSLMPEGQLDPLPEEEIRGLLKYLMSPTQIPAATSLPK